MNFRNNWRGALRQSLRFTLMSIIALGLVGCGGDDDDDDDFTGENAEVVELGAEDTSLRVGDATVVRTDITFSDDEVFNDNRSVVVVVKLPAGLRFREGTAEVQGSGGDEQIGARVSRCSNGETFVEFEVDDDDLDFAENPDGDADGRITFTVDAVSVQGLVNIEGRAGYDSLFYTCDQQFLSDTATIISITS